jgi:S1-C subfamily serine protease
MRHYLLGGLTGVLLGFVSGTSFGADPGRLYHKYVQTVVRIHTPTGEGTGVIINRAGDILTNAHIVDYATATVIVIPYPGDAFYTAKIIKFDTRKDLALLDIKGAGVTWKYLKLRKKEVYIGEPVYSIGHPYGNLWSFSQGIISGDRTYFGGNSRTQASVVANRGSSGSPLFDKKGRLVGLVMGMYHKRSGGWSGVALAVSLEDIRLFLQKKLTLGDLKWPKQSRIRNRTLEKEASFFLFDALNVGKDPKGVKITPWP